MSGAGGEGGGDGGRGSFLAGWSRRKRAARLDDAAERQEPAEEPAAGAAPLIAEPEPDVPDLAALPALDEIVAGTDMRPFLAKGVPAGLRNAALRKLWMATPGVRDHVDPALDYAWDWNAPGGVPGGGGSLTEAGVARMVRDLIGGKAGAEGDAPSDPVPPAPPPDRMAEADAAAPAAPPQPSAVRRSDPPAQARPEPRASDRQDTRRSDAPEPLAPARRHGGAVPD